MQSTNAILEGLNSLSLSDKNEEINNSIEDFKAKLQTIKIWAERRKFIVKDYFEQIDEAGGNINRGFLILANQLTKIAINPQQSQIEEYLNQFSATCLNERKRVEKISSKIELEESHLEKKLATLPPEAKQKDILNQIENRNSDELLLANNLMDIILTYESMISFSLEQATNTIENSKKLEKATINVVTSDNVKALNIFNTENIPFNYTTLTESEKFLKKIDFESGRLKNWTKVQNNQIPKIKENYLSKSIDLGTMLDLTQQHIDRIKARMPEIKKFFEDAISQTQELYENIFIANFDVFKWERKLNALDNSDLAQNYFDLLIPYFKVLQETLLRTRTALKEAQNTIGKITSTISSWTREKCEVEALKWMSAESDNMEIVKEEQSSTKPGLG